MKAQITGGSGGMPGWGGLTWQPVLIQAILDMRPSKSERGINRARMLKEGLSDLQKYGWFFTPFSKLSRPGKVATGLLNWGVGSLDDLFVSGGIGAPIVSSPTALPTLVKDRQRPPRLSSQSSRQGRESSEPGKHGVSRQSSQRRDRARRGECPKGHYWSYKEKKCVKSKFN